MPKQITVGSSSMDALTPTFATCNLNYSVPKDPASTENQSLSPGVRNPQRRAIHFTGNNVNQNKESSAANANAFDGSGAESSGYHSASSLSTASSDSEYSDSEAGQTARLRYSLYSCGKMCNNYWFLLLGVLSFKIAPYPLRLCHMAQILLQVQYFLNLYQIWTGKRALRDLNIGCIIYKHCYDIRLD